MFLQENSVHKTDQDIKQAINSLHMHVYGSYGGHKYNNDASKWMVMINVLQMHRKGCYGDDNVLQIRVEQDRFWPIKQESRLSFLNLNFNQDSRICLVKYQCQSRFEISKLKILISIKIQDIFGGNDVIKQDTRTHGKSWDQARFKTTLKKIKKNKMVYSSSEL